MNALTLARNSTAITTGHDTAASPEFVLSDHAALVTSDDGTTVLADMNGQFFGLSETAECMLRLCLEQGRNKAIERLADDYDVAPELIGHDLDDLLGRLLRAGAIEQRDRRRPPTFRRFAGRMAARLAAFAMRRASTT
ncbi:MAG: PqqD family peptide modification chaperone, partial [Hyphomicrobiaceae bacterium]|nr:PqqD family peptide modification chaperone [Hyphomicrobiaceae bacterium]